MAGALLAASAGLNVRVYSLSGGAALDPDLWPGTVSAGFRVLADGTIEKIETGEIWSQINSSTDWVIPNAAAGTQYARMTVDTGDDFDNGDARATWLAVSTNPEWYFQGSLKNYLKSNSCTLEIATDAAGANVVASGTYTADCENVF